MSGAPPRPTLLSARTSGYSITEPWTWVNQTGGPAGRLGAFHWPALTSDISLASLLSRVNHVGGPAGRPKPGAVARRSALTSGRPSDISITMPMSRANQASWPAVRTEVD